MRKLLLLQALLRTLVDQGVQPFFYFQRTFCQVKQVCYKMIFIYSLFIIYYDLKSYSILSKI